MSDTDTGSSTGRRNLLMTGDQYDFTPKRRSIHEPWYVR